MTNATKTVGGAIASSIFAIALASTGSIDDPPRRATPRSSGYLTVWTVCAVAAVLAAASLLLLPAATASESVETADVDLAQWSTGVP